MMLLMTQSPVWGALHAAWWSWWLFTAVMVVDFALLCSWALRAPTPEERFQENFRKLQREMHL